MSVGRLVGWHQSYCPSARHSAVDVDGLVVGEHIAQVSPSIGPNTALATDDLNSLPNTHCNSIARGGMPFADLQGLDVALFLTVVGAVDVDGLITGQHVPQSNIGAAMVWIDLDGLVEALLRSVGGAANINGLITGYQSRT